MKSILIILFFFSVNIFPQTWKDFDKLFSKIPKGAVEISPSVKGKNIDTKLLKYLGEGQNDLQSGQLYQAVYKYNLSKDLTAYIICYPPAETTFERVFINIYNAFHQCVSSIIVAEASGDEGWSTTTASWLIDFNNDGNLDFISSSTEQSPSGEKTTRLKINLWGGNAYIGHNVN